MVRCFSATHVIENCCRKGFLMYVRYTINAHEIGLTCSCSLKMYYSYGTSHMVRGVYFRFCLFPARSAIEL